jgi:hypothetical protein
VTLTGRVARLERLDSVGGGARLGRGGGGARAAVRITMSMGTKPTGFAIPNPYAPD